MLDVALAVAALAWSSTATFPGGGLDEAVPRTSVASDGTSYTVWLDGKRLVASAGDRYGFTRPERIAREAYAYVAAAAPGGRGAVAYVRRHGVHVKVRGGRDRLVIRSRRETYDLALAADPRGGWVLAAERSDRIVVRSLGPDGHPSGPAQSLGLGYFGAQARPTQALAVTRDGTAFVAFTAQIEGLDRSFAAVATRPHGGRFDAPREVSHSETTVEEAGVTASGDHVVVSALRSTLCGDAGCSGFPLAGPPGGRLRGPALAHPNRAFGPTAAGSALVFQLKPRPRGFSRIAPVRAVSLEHPDRLQTLTRAPAREPIALALCGGRALALWATVRGWGAAVAGRDGRFHAIAAPPGPPPGTWHFAETNRDAAAAGRYAIVAWGSGREIWIATRRI